MSKADTSTWTPLDYVCSLMMAWARGEDRPPTGALVKLVTEENISKTVVV